jgi:hypothetical protein
MLALLMIDSQEGTCKMKRTKKVAKAKEWMLTNIQ